MSAPVLIALAHGSRDRRSGAVVTALAELARAVRPDVAIEAAFLEHTRPDVDAVVSRLADRGYTEFVVVPLLLSSAYHAKVDIPSVVDRVRAQHPGVGLRIAKPIGPDPSLLAVLDLRLRQSLRLGRVGDLDGLVLSSAGSSDPDATAAMRRLARVWSIRRRLPVKVAFASSAEPTTSEALEEFSHQGRSRVAVGSFFLAPGVLLDRTGRVALESGAVAVSDPLGVHERLARLMLGRYTVGARDPAPPLRWHSRLGGYRDSRGAGAGGPNECEVAVLESTLG